MPYRFIVCATQRSGSTMVCDDFANQDVMGAPFEYFLHDLQKGKKKRFDVDEVMSRGRDRKGNEAVKLMANYLQEIDRALPDHHRLTGPFANLYHALQSGIWFYVYRRELDRQALSRLRAQKSGIYHLRTDHGRFAVGGAVFDESKLRASDRLTYSAEMKSALLNEINAILTEEELWKSFFSVWTIKPIEIEYEYAASATTNYLADIVETLGYAPHPVLPKRSLARMSDNLADEIIAEFRSDLAADGLPEPFAFRSLYAATDPLMTQRHIGSRAFE